MRAIPLYQPKNRDGRAGGGVGLHPTEVEPRYFYSPWYTTEHAREAREYPNWVNYQGMALSGDGKTLALAANRQIGIFTLNSDAKIVSHRVVRVEQGMGAETDYPSIHLSHDGNTILLNMRESLYLNHLLVRKVDTLPDQIKISEYQSSESRVTSKGSGRAGITVSALSPDGSQFSHVTAKEYLTMDRTPLLGFSDGNRLLSVRNLNSREFRFEAVETGPPAERAFESVFFPRIGDEGVPDGANHYLLADNLTKLAVIGSFNKFSIFAREGSKGFTRRVFRYSLPLSCPEALFAQPDTQVDAAAFSEDGSTLLLAYREGTLKVIDVKP